MVLFENIKIYIVIFIIKITRIANEKDKESSILLMETDMKVILFV